MATENQYRWANPYQWLESAVDGWTEETIKQTLLSLALQMNSDNLQDMFQDEMDADGYFTPNASECIDCGEWFNSEEGFIYPNGDMCSDCHESKVDGVI